MIKVGDVLHLHDSVTGFSGKDRARWCVVTVVIGRHIRVAGRSTARTDGVPLPASAMPEFTADGWVLRPPVRVSLGEASAARKIGSLPHRYLEQVMFFVDTDMP